METITEREVDTHKTAVAKDGRVVQERTHSVATDASPKTTFINLIRFIYGLVAILLAARFILKITGANGASGFVKFIYSITAFLSKPFDSVFGVKTTSTAHFTSVFEPSILVAIVVYGLIAWGIIKLIDINRPKDASVA